MTSTPEQGGHHYLQSHDISGEILPLNIETESRTILEAAAAAAVGHAAKTLVKEGPLRIVILGFRAGASVREHEAAGPVSVHVLSGDVEVTAGGRSNRLSAGQAVVLGASLSHAVHAHVESVVLLTIAFPSS